MRQTTLPEQTAKLIELGFEKPKTKVSFEVGNDELGYTYSMGELIEMLPISFEIENDITVWLEIEVGIGWSVLYSYCGSAEYDCEGKELIDALFDMIVKLKEEGVI